MTLPTPDTLVYASMASETPPTQTRDDMTTMSQWLAKGGWHLASGGEHAADQAFAKGTAPDQQTRYVPWTGYNDLAGPDCTPLDREQFQTCEYLADRLHPSWDQFTDDTKIRCAREAAMLLGPNLDRPVDALIAWSPKAASKTETSIAPRIAAQYGIPVLNLATMSPRQACEQLRNIRHAHTEVTTAMNASKAPANGMTRHSAAKNPPYVDILADLKQLRTAHGQQEKQAETAHIDPVLLPDRNSLVIAAQTLQNQPYASKLPLADQLTCRFVIENQQRHNECIQEIADACARFDKSSHTHSHLEYTANTNNIPIASLDGYDNWLADAKELSTLGHESITEHSVYDSAFTPDTWSEITQYLADIDTAIGEDTVYLIAKDLYLPPIAYNPTLPTEQQDAHAAYRAHRENWHGHIAYADLYDYPYDARDNTKLMKVTEQLLDTKHIPAEARQALAILHDDFVGYKNAREDITHHLEKTKPALAKADSFIDSFEKVNGLNITPDDINGYTEWRAESQQLLNDAEQFTVAGNVYCDRYLKHNEEVKTDVEMYMIDLHDRMEHFSPCDTPRIDKAAAHYRVLEYEEPTARYEEPASRGIKM